MLHHAHISKNSAFHQSTKASRRIRCPIGRGEAQHSLPWLRVCSGHRATTVFRGRGRGVVQRGKIHKWQLLLKQSSRRLLPPSCRSLPQNHDPSRRQPRASCDVGDCGDVCGERRANETKGNHPATAVAVRLPSCSWPSQVRSTDLPRPPKLGLFMHDIVSLSVGRILSVTLASVASIPRSSMQTQ